MRCVIRSPLLSVGICCGLIAHGPLAAQEVQHDEIVVTGASLPDPPSDPAYSSIEIERDRLISTASGRIEDALSLVAGVQQFRRSDSRSSNPSAQGLTLRALGGNATSRALLLLDGVPMVDPFFGYVPLSALAPERLASARVTRGGGSGPFGAGALSGTIELESAGSDTLDVVSGMASVDDRGDSELTTTVAPRIGTGFAVLSARWDHGPGFWTTPEDQRVPASVRARYESASVQLRAVAPLSGDIELQARLLAFDDRRTLRFRGADNSMEGQDASLRVVGRGPWQFDALAYVQARNFSNVVISSTRFVPTLDQRATPATGLGGKIELRPPLGRAHVLRLGLDYRGSVGTLFENAISTTNGQVTEQRSAGGRNGDFGLFLEDSWTIGNFVLTGGVRADRSIISDGFYETASPTGTITSRTQFPDRSSWNVSARGGALLKLEDGLSLRVAGYTGLRLPTLNELYRPFVVFPVVTEANAALRNERLVGYEAGLDWSLSDSATVSLTAFDNRIRDAIANVTIAPNLRRRQNIEAIRARGVEASAFARLGAMRLDASMALTDATSQGSGLAAGLDSKRPAQTPRFAATGTLAWQARNGALLSATLRHTGAQFEDDLESDVLCAATTLDGFARIPLGGNLSLVLRGENLTDETVITRNQAGSLDLGAPRTAWIGIQIGN